MYTSKSCFAANDVHFSRRMSNIRQVWLTLRVYPLKDIRQVLLMSNMYMSEMSNMYMYTPEKTFAKC